LDAETVQVSTNPEELSITNQSQEHHLCAFPATEAKLGTRLHSTIYEQYGWALCIILQILMVGDLDTYDISPYSLPSDTQGLQAIFGRLSGILNLRGGRVVIKVRCLI